MTRLRLAAATAPALLAALALAAPAAAKVVHPLEGGFNGSETPAGSFTPLGVAVDQASHDLYVSDSAHKLIDKYRPKPGEPGSYEYLCQITGLGKSSTSASECDRSAAGPGALSSGFGQGIVEPGGDLLFPDASAHAIDRFSSSGEYLPPQLGVPGGGSPSQVALDAAGNLYVDVADASHHLIDKYTAVSETWSTFATGTPAGPFASPSPSGVAVDTDASSPAFGDVYVADPKRGAVAVFTAAGAFVEEITATPAGPLSTLLGKLAVDPGDGHLFVPDAANRALDEFAPGGAFVSRTLVPSTSVASSPQGVAIDSSTGTLYVADKANSRIDAFATFALPDVETRAATAVEETSATLNGHLGPDLADGGSEVTECEFEYVEAAHYEASAPDPYAAGETAPCAPAPPYAGPEDVSADVSLSPSTTYHFRLVAANANAIPSNGEDETLTTSGPPMIAVQGAHVSGVNVEFKSQVNPIGAETTCEVQYVEEAEYDPSAPNPYAAGETASCLEGLGSGFGAVEAQAKAEGLRIATTYHYRFLAGNSAGQAEGPDRTFITFGIHDVEFEILNEEGAGHPYAQAGGHPYELIANFGINWTENFGGPFANSDHPNEVPTGNLRSVVAELPPGLAGNPAATPRCTRTDVIRFKCSGAAQVGQLSITEATGSSDRNYGYRLALYNVVPPKGVVAEFGANAEQHATVFIGFRLRPDGNYAVTSESPNNPDVIGVTGVFANFWGVPADPSHDALRKCPSPSGEGEFGPCSAHEPQPKPLLFDPTSCGGPLRTVLAVDSYQTAGLFDRHPIETEPITGCNQLEFTPALEARPTTNHADSPTGLSVDLHIPQKPEIEDPEGKREADLEDSVVTLPQGLNVNPAAASGLEACSSSQIGLKTAPAETPIRFSGSPAQCPDGSKIGTVELLTPVLTEEDQNHNPTGERPLPGAVYLAAPHDNPFDSLLAIYIAIEDPRTGIVVKLAGHVEADPQTGQLTATFDENPQLPFEDFKLKFFGGAHSSLRTPSTCGTYRTTSALTPWSAPETGPPATPSDTWQIRQSAAGEACPSAPAEEAHDPSFEAGTEAPVAGAYSPLVLHLSRADGSQELKGIDTILPPGLTGKLAGVAECPQGDLEAAEKKSGTDEQANPSCPAASQVGIINVGAGAGPAPFYVQGNAYLAGPYKGAPLSLAIVTPAVAGPFDLGTVVVRVALYVNPETAQITAKSDPIPTILQGIPLDVRSIAVKMTRNQFSLNPTSCEKMAVGGEALSVLGQTAALSSPFQVGGCKALGFAPKLALSLKGKTRRGGFPAAKAVLRMPPGDANIARTQVTLPHAEYVANAHLGSPCTHVQYAAKSCPASSVLGTARAETPLLDQPLEGPVYLMSGFGHLLPDVAIDLGGQIHVFVHSRVDTGKNGGLRNTFEVVPDAPVSKFTLELLGGSRGLLENSENICSKPQHAFAHFVGQNGKVSDTEPVLHVKCPKGRRGKGHKGHRNSRAG